MRTAATEADYRAALEAMIEESDGLIRTFDALLMIARAESGQARDNMVEFDAAEIVRGVSELYEPVADDNGLRCAADAPEPAMIRGNRELLSQALANLVDNAIKYAKPAPDAEAASGKGSGEIVVGARREGARVLITVADRGPGIAQEDRSRVVERFVRLTHDTAEPGSGSRPQPCGRGRAAAWRGADPGGQCAGVAGRDLASNALKLCRFSRNLPCPRRLVSQSVIRGLFDPEFARDQKAMVEPAKRAAKKPSRGRPRPLRRRSGRRLSFPRPRRRARASTSGSAKSRAPRPARRSSNSSLRRNSRSSAMWSPRSPRLRPTSGT